MREEVRRPRWRGCRSQADPQEIVAELEYADPNGEVLTTSTRIPLWPAALIVGMKPDSWALSQDQVKFQAVVLDLAGKPVAGVPVSVDLFERKTFSHRKRLLGGFYAYQSGAQVKRLQPASARGAATTRGCCSAIRLAGVGRAAGAGACARTAMATSPWPAPACGWQARESGGSTCPTTTAWTCCPSASATSRARQQCSRCACRFAQATALVTVEREGVMDVQVVPLSGKAPVVNVPVRGNHAPNVFVSVLAVRGRVADVQPTALVDLGKPAFKMGVAQINVGWRAHELKVNVSTDRQVYRVRDKAKVSVEVRRALDGKPPRERLGGRAGGGGRGSARACTERELEAAGDDDAAARASKWTRRPLPCRWWASATTDARRARRAAAAGARPAASCSTRCCSGRRA